MTLEEYIRNPMGKGNAVYSQRFVYEELYTKKFNLLVAREAGIWKTQCIISNEKEYYLYIQIPSESVEHFFWDTVIGFKTGDGDLEKSHSLTGYDIQFFSNDPSFAYTFAHAFNKNGLFIKDLESKMVEKCLKEKAMEKNPKDEIGYVKSLYFAYLEIKDKGLLLKSRWEAITRPYSPKVWIATVGHAYDVIEDRKRRGEEIAAKERKEKKKTSNTTEPSKTHNKPFGSPNQPKIGQFKRTDYNTIPKSGTMVKKGIGHFVNPFKKKK